VRLHYRIWGNVPNFGCTFHAKIEVLQLVTRTFQRGTRIPETTPRKRESPTSRINCVTSDFLSNFGQRKFGSERLRSGHH
jgi:hypothetical protein